MWKRLRIAFLLYVLAFIAIGQWLTARRSTSWESPLRINVYPVAGDHAVSTRDYVDNLSRTEFNDLERFFAAEAERYEVRLERPLRIAVMPPYRGELPTLAGSGSPLATLLWSLRMRWLAARLEWSARGPSADIVAFTVFHAANEGVVLDRSTALRKGLIAVANLFAEGSARGANQMVLAHEVLHTLGARDKYAGPEHLPEYPQGYAEPDAVPRLPQKKAELMAGRIPLDAGHARIPDSLSQVAIGPVTAAEIGWMPR
jgi:hypothetical protein